MARFHTENPGELIRTARLDLGLTQAELARRSGLRQPSLAQMESGKRSVSPEMLERVLKAADYRPSLALAEHLDAVIAAAAHRGLRNVRVFGSAARGDDNFDSDIDLLVSLDERIDLFDIALFSEDVRRLTGFPTDVIVDNGRTRMSDEIQREAVAL